MAKQQTKRRRKRYQPGSAYAGDVKPRGIFSIFGNVRLFYFLGVFIMLASLGIGGFFTSGLLTGGVGRNTQGFVVQEDVDDEDQDAADQQQAPRFTAPPPMTIDTSKRYVATIKTELGDIQIELFDDQVPETVNNFVFLAREGFYDGLAFHQVFPGFSVQAGDPTGTGTGGPGYELPQEAPGGPYEPGTVGMANASQFFIALDTSDVFERYTPFGKVIQGLDVAERIQRGTTIETIEIQEQ